MSERLDSRAIPWNGHGRQPSPRLADLLHDVRAFIIRYVVLSPDGGRYALAIWVVHTHVIDRLDCTPYLDINERDEARRQDATPRGARAARGATLAHLAASARPSLVRKVDKEQPTLLLDESGRGVQGRARNTRKCLRGLLNSGYRRIGTSDDLCVGQGATLAYRDFSHVRREGDRRHRRAARDGRGSERFVIDPAPPDAQNELCERWRQRDGHAAAAPLPCGSSLTWASTGRPRRDAAAARGRRSSKALSDRQADVWEPCWRSRTWLAPTGRTRRGTRPYTLTATDEDKDIYVELLRDINEILQMFTESVIRTKDSWRSWSSARTGRGRPAPR